MPKGMYKHKKHNEGDFVECECGARIYGTSKAHAKSLLPAHRRSKLHKSIMEIKKRKGS